MGMTPEQERKKADALAYIEFMRKSDELLKDIGSVSYGGAEQILNQLNAYKDKYGHALTTGRLDTAISEWEGIVQDKRERYERTADIRNAYDNQIASIDANLKRNEDMIAGQREGAIKQAYSNYDRSKSTYGQNAEKLARMGLDNSGYSDYLIGVAYGNMVGGIENANTTANEALEKAYYNADQQKLQAAAERDTAIANAEKAYGEKEASLIAAINSGEIDLETAIGMAKAYNLTSGTIANLENVAKAYEDKVKTEDTKNAITTLDTYFGGNYTDEYGNPVIYTEQQIRDLATKAGYDETKIEQLVKDNNDKVKNIYLSGVDANTRVEDIQELDVDGEIKQAMSDKDILEAVKQFTQTDVTTGALEEVEKARAYISEDAYQEAYFINSLALVEAFKEGEIDSDELLSTLNKYKEGGQLNPTDTESLKQYAQEIINNKNKGVVSFSLVRPGALDAMMLGEDSSGHITIDGKTYFLNLTRSGYSGGKLDNIVDAYVGMTAKIGGNYYVFGHDKEWHKVQRLGTASGFFDAVDEHVKDLKTTTDAWQTKTNPPKHTRAS